MMEFTDDELDTLNRACQTRYMALSRMPRDVTDVGWTALYNVIDVESEAVRKAWKRVDIERQRRAAIKQAVSVAG